MTPPANAQEISEGLYIGHRGVIVPKYYIMEVSGDSASFEMFVRWQGSWLPGVGTWEHGYQPQTLTRNDKQSVSNENITVVFHQEKKLKGTAMQTIAGKFKFKLRQQDELPARYKTVKDEAIGFTKSS